MMPAQPPLPTAWYLPFQPSEGSHTSTLMSESDDGVSVAATRQWAGSNSGGTAGAPPRPPAGAAAAGAPPARPGCTKGPAGTSSADVIVTFGNASDLRLAQGVAAQAGAASSRADSAQSTRVVMDILPSEAPDSIAFIERFVRWSRTDGSWHRRRRQ